MPNLNKLILPEAFKYKDDVTVKGGTHFAPPHTARYRSSYVLLQLLLFVHSQPFPISQLVSLPPVFPGYPSP